MAAKKNEGQLALRAGSLLMGLQADQATFLAAAALETSSMSLEQAKEAELQSKGLADYYAEQAEHEAVARRHAQLALLAARRVAEVLAAEKGSPGRKRNGMHACRFSKMERETYYKIAACPEDAFRVYLEEEEQPSKRGVVQLAKKLARTAKKAAQPKPKVSPLIVETQKRMKALTAWLQKTRAKAKRVEEQRLLLAAMESVCEGIEVLGRYGHEITGTGMVSAGVIRAHELFDEERA